MTTSNHAPGCAATTSTISSRSTRTSLSGNARFSVGKGKVAECSDRSGLRESKPKPRVRETVGSSVRDLLSLGGLESDARKAARRAEFHRRTVQIRRVREERRAKEQLEAPRPRKPVRIFPSATPRRWTNICPLPINRRQTGGRRVRGSCERLCRHRKPYPAGRTQLGNLLENGTRPRNNPQLSDKKNSFGNPEKLEMMRAMLSIAGLGRRWYAESWKCRGMRFRRAYVSCLFAFLTSGSALSGSALLC